VNYNKHNPTKKISVDHSSLDRKCPRMHAVIEKYRLNTEYYWLVGKMSLLSKEQDGGN